jgi:REP element-mobilizing transposase RayT
MVASAIRYFDGQRYRLYAWCVMPNHVHAVLQPLGGWRLAQILHSWKSFTAKRANVLLNRDGEFWQREYYDRMLRDEREFLRAVRYVGDNPVKAGLRDWPWVWTYLADLGNASSTGPGH